MSERELRTKLEYPRIDEIFKTWKNESTWGKTWKIFENTGVKLTINVCLFKIDCINKDLRFIVIARQSKVDDKSGETYTFDETMCFDINIREDVTQKIFEQKILWCAFNLIDVKENSAIYELPEYKELEAKYAKEIKELVFNYHNSKVLEVNKLKSVEDVSDELIKFYTGLNGELHRESDKLCEVKRLFLKRNHYKLWIDVYKHFISLIPYEDIKKKYVSLIEIYRKVYETK